MTIDAFCPICHFGLSRLAGQLVYLAPAGAAQHCRAGLLRPPMDPIGMELHQEDLAATSVAVAILCLSTVDAAEESSM